jgi:hypothetical protein
MFKTDASGEFHPRRKPPIWTPTVQQCRQRLMCNGVLHACGVSVKKGSSCDDCGAKEDGSYDTDPDG